MEAIQPEVWRNKS